MDQIKYKQGEFRSFTATRSFALGDANGKDINVIKDTELEFDGRTVRYDGEERSLPQLRAAVNTRWIVLTESYDSEDTSYGKPVAANIKMRSATGDNKEAKSVPVTTESDERIVMSSADHKKYVVDTNTGVAEAQDGVVLGRRFKTSAKSQSSLTAENAASTLRSVDRVQIEAGKGRSEADLLASMSDGERDEYLSRKQALRAQYVTESEDRVVGSVKTASKRESGGVTLTQEVGGGVETADLAGVSEGTPTESTVVQDGITFRTTNGPKGKDQVHPREVSDNPSLALGDTMDARRQIARAVCPDFPQAYDFSASTKKKVARLVADFEDRPDVIRAVFAAETDEVKATLITEFPEAFRG